jgi:hypothetical protein
MQKNASAIEWSSLFLFFNWPVLHNNNNALKLPSGVNAAAI